MSCRVRFALPVNKCGIHLAVIRGDETWVHFLTHSKNQQQNMDYQNTAVVHQLPKDRKKAKFVIFFDFFVLWYNYM